MPPQTLALAQFVLQRTRFEGDIADLHEYDAAYSVPGLGRYRVNIYRQRGSIAIALRNIPLVIPSFEALGAPPVVGSLCELERGLVLVVGAAGNGKSSTLAAMIGHINQTRRVHIVTIEDPIEYIFEDKKATINQREIGIDCLDFKIALRALVRENPDVVLVGEMRDKETFEAALNAAETGSGGHCCSSPTRARRATTRSRARPDG